MPAYPPSSVAVGAVFKRTVYGSVTDLSTTSTSFINISGNFPALSLTLAVGETAALLFYACFAKSNSGAPILIDWLIDQPVSADTNFRTLNGGGSAGTIELGSQATDCNTVPIRAVFTATEAGVHTFTPQWKVTGGIAYVVLAAPYGHAATHMVSALGTPSA